jgi:hypothetical protein
MLGGIMRLLVNSKWTATEEINILLSRKTEHGLSRTIFFEDEEFF